MEETSLSYTTPDNRESGAPNTTNSPTRKRQKTAIFETLAGRCPSPLQIEPEVSATERKQKNEDFCPIYGLSNDELKHIFGYAGEKQYGFIACTSDRFRQVYLETFRGEALTSFKGAVASVSCAAVCLDSKEPGCDSHARSLFNRAAEERKVEVLIWGEESGYDLKHLLDENTIAPAALNGHLDVVKYLRQLDILWNEWTCAYAAWNGHLELLKWAKSNQCPWDEVSYVRLCCHGWSP